MYLPPVEKQEKTEYNLDIPKISKDIKQVLNLHEVGVVSGLEGIEAILKEAETTDLKLYFVVPSHVPFSPNLETSGGRFNPDKKEKAKMTINCFKYFIIFFSCSPLFLCLPI